MAEAAALASGIAGLLSLTITVIDTSCGYISKVNGASQSISICLEELRCLKNLLNELDELAHSPATMVIFMDRAPALISTANTSQCQNEIDQLRLRLDGQTKEDEIHGIVERLRGYRDIFHTALSADGFVVGAITLKAVRSIQDGLQDDKNEKILNWLSPSNVQDKQNDVFNL